MLELQQGKHPPRFVSAGVFYMFDKEDIKE
jgi:hypothetical protein